MNLWTSTIYGLGRGGVSRCRHLLKGGLIKENGLPINCQRGWGNIILQSLKGSGKFYSDTIIPPNPPSPTPLPVATNHEQFLTSRDNIISFLLRNVLSLCCRFLLHFAHLRGQIISVMIEKRGLTTLMRKVKNGNR